jgi:diadenosine tetraphosphatase ApaH/serine/threonine PP2A family protein phosphatase
VRAIISDIHANLEALTAVLADIQANRVEEVYFLGDLVGYGPDPDACTDLVMDRCRVTLKGNHDFALIHGPYGFNYIAAEAIDCTRHSMLPRCYLMDRKKKKRWSFIDSLKDTHVEADTLYVHGSPLDPISDYVFCKNARYMWNESKLTEIFGKFGRLMFCGHTHHPCIIYDDFECLLPSEVDYRIELDPGRKAIVNVGSVGQPRDHDTRSCYVLYDPEARTIVWRRVVYDYEETARKIDAIECIDNRCGDRLKVGM